jgi:SAM-dependent methyltransferase
LARVRARDPAPSARTWDAQYTAGRWAYVGQLSEISRFSVLVGYLRHFVPGGSVLDLGCGQGFLLQRLQPPDYSRYVGVDFSRAAIDKAMELGLPKATFTTADIDVYVPTETFDAIVCTESLCYLATPLRTVERYVPHLDKGGVLLVSMNTNFRGGLAIVRALKQRYSTLDEVRLTHPDRHRSWVCIVLSVK